MDASCTRRGFLALTGVAGLALAAGCSSDKPAPGTPDGGSVTITHLFGETTIPSPPQRVVTAGYTDADDVLAVGIVPIATTEWWGGEPFAVWPWGRAALGAAQPEVLSLDDGIDVARISALKPDLIVATNAGLDADTYQKLSAIAPTVPQPGRAAFFSPWKDRAKTIGTACFQSPRMTELITAVDKKFTTAAGNNAEFKGRKALLLGGNTSYRNSVTATLPGWRTEFLTQLGFTIPDGLSGYTDGDRAVIPLDKIAGVLDAADVLIWTTESDDEQARLLAEPAIAGLRASSTGRNVFTGRELSAAIAYSSVLSLPVVADTLPPLLAKALDG